MSSEPFACHMIATREPNGSLWSFYLVNDGTSSIDFVELQSVNYEWGDTYVGHESPDVKVANVAAGDRVMIWRDDGSSEMRTDLCLHVLHRGVESWLLFEFPKLYRQQGTTLAAKPLTIDRPPH